VTATSINTGFSSSTSVHVSQQYHFFTVITCLVSRGMNAGRSSNGLRVEVCITVSKNFLLAVFDQQSHEPSAYGLHLDKTPPNERAIHAIPSRIVFRCEIDTKENYSLLVVKRQ
jgi:hypothetical protein